LASVVQVIRAQRAEDAAAVRRLLAEAFADDGRVAALADALLARPDQPGAAFVAEEDGAVVGHVQLSLAWVDAPTRVVDVLVLSPLGVAPAHRNRGIGRALCAEAVAAAERLGAPALFLEGDPGYYAKLGWQRASTYGFTAPSTRIPDAAFQVVVLPMWETWMTGALVYNDTFWAHDCVGLRDGTT
jgi:putative acetyltransferase